MPGFANEDEMYKYIGGIFQMAFEDPELGPKLKATNLVWSNQCTEPDAVVTVDAANGKVYRGQEGPEPLAVFVMTTETANGYWQGKVNLPFAMARGKVKVTGDVAKVLALAPLGKKLFPRYVEMLKADGRDDLVV